MNLPPDLGTIAVPENTAILRQELINLPKEYRSWSLRSHPQGDSVRKVISWVADWASTEVPRVPGLVFWGPAGTGKTGLAVGLAKVTAELGYGDLGLWNMLVLRHLRKQEGQQKPAPVWFETWSNFSGRLRRAKFGKDVEYSSDDAMLDELDERCYLLVVDDIDVDGMSAWKESVLLRLLRRVERGQKLVMTTNAAPKDFMLRFGERCADRLMSESRVVLIGLSGRSLRRS